MLRTNRASNERKFPRRALEESVTLDYGWILMKKDGAPC